MLQDMWWFLEGNWDTLIELILAVILVAEIAVRLTPTKTDDGAVERVGSWIKKILNMVKIPNRIKEP